MRYVVCKSYILGHFDGYQYGDEHHLDDGSAWRVTSAIYLRRRKNGPSACVFRDGQRYYMQVKGMPHDVEVEPIHLPRFMLETPIGYRSNGELESQLELGMTINQALKKWRTCEAIFQQSLYDA